MRNTAEAPRLARERQTVRRMLEIFCRDQHTHRHGPLCDKCDGLYSYAMRRLDGCIYQEHKPTCKKCPVHCYKRDRRAEMRAVMIYSGPRMLWSHPVLAIRHLLDERKPAPAHPSRPAPG